MNQVDPRFLYVTPRQAELWREVSRRHSPVHRDPAFRGIYEEAFRKIVERPHGPGEILLVGLGCGTGEKEAQWLGYLRGAGRAVSFCAIDVSRDLVLEAADRLASAGARPLRSRVCDLGKIESWRDWLDGQGGSRARAVSFFGLVPNFAPSLVAGIWRAALRPGDTLLASVHLAPVADETGAGIVDAMRSVLPQYDNPETLAWLQEGLRALDLDALVHPPRIVIGEVDGIPAFLGIAAWKEDEYKKPLRLFASLRYTAGAFEALTRREGFATELLAITPCRQEAIWCIRRAG